MHSSILLAVWAFVSFILYKIVATIIVSVRHANTARRLGCQPAHNIQGFDPLGFVSIHKVLKADRGQRIPQFLKDRIDNACAKEGRRITTFYQRIMGAGSHFTIEPRNIQAVLATQFKDFGLGERRNVNFFPLLGWGIVSSLHLSSLGYCLGIADTKTVLYRRKRMGACEGVTETSICSRSG